MCNNCKLREGLLKLLNKYNMWTSHWSAEMDDEDTWFCKDNESGICSDLEESKSDNDNDNNPKLCRKLNETSKMNK